MKARPTRTTKFPRRALLIVLLSVLLLVLVGGQIRTAAAQTSPWEAAESMRKALFAAQTALLAGDSAGAADKIASAESLYRQSLDTTIRAAAPDLAASLSADLAAASAAAQAGEVARLAGLRGQIWAGLLNGSHAVVFGALEQGNVNLAGEWLLLREFRTPTRFSRARADATMALKAASEGKEQPAEALTIVRADLLDTYQARLDEALADLDLALKRGFAAKAAEASGLASGYFGILADEYRAQRSTQALTDARQHFTALGEAILGGDSARVEAERTAVQAALKGFRAVPLSEPEQARRAGQLLRYLPLVLVEYKRGVRDGRVINDIEIQEALTFREGAAAAFADLQLPLSARDSSTTDRIGALIDQADTQIRETAAPSALESTINETLSLLGKVLPAEWQAMNSGSDFDVIASVLDQIAVAVRAGQYDKAESARIEAYAILDSGIEQRLNGFAPDLAVRVETLFWHGTAQQPGLATLLAEQATAAEVNKALAALRGTLAEAQTVLSSKSAPTAVAGNAAVIVFREGLEAVLILASLLASLRGAQTLKFRRPIIAGAVLALGASALTWWIANSLLMSLIQFGERLEAVVSLIAIGVLLVILNWFFHKVYWTGWIAGFHSRKGQIIAGGLALGQIVGLVVLGFSSIYREGFETVLFLQSLVLDAGIGVVMQGVALGLAGTAVVGVITFGLQVRLPYKKMLIVTGVMIGAVLLIMVGNTVHVLQAVGWLPVTPIPGLFFPHWMGQWFGLYGTWQGIGLQVLAAAYVIGTYFWAERMNHRKRKTVKQPAKLTPQPNTAQGE